MSNTASAVRGMGGEYISAGKDSHLGCQEKSVISLLPYLKAAEFAVVVLIGYVNVFYNSD